MENRTRSEGTLLHRARASRVSSLLLTTLNRTRTSLDYAQANYNATPPNKLESSRPRRAKF